MSAEQKPIFEAEGAEKQSASLGFSSRAIHYAFKPADFSNSVQPPVFLTSTFGYESAAANDLAFTQGGMIYAREHNPTTKILEERLANLEGAEAGLVFASGMGAFGAFALSLLSQGDELIVHHTLYIYTTAMVQEALPRFGIKVVPVDLSNLDALDAAITNKTRFVYFETPVNPLLEVLDIAAICGRADAHGVRVAVDGTFASPALQRPLEHGASIVLHSLTKYINGHGDALGGALLGDAETIQQIRATGMRYITGATLSPLSAFLILRGLKTLTLRMERHSSSALSIASMLEAHPAVSWVRYPFLASHPAEAIARKQMSNGSGMMSFGLHLGFDGARQLVDNLNMITLAVSLGDADSLITHPASFKRAAQLTQEGVAKTKGVGDDLVRLSVGLEDCNDLILDLQQAMERL